MCGSAPTFNPMVKRRSAAAGSLDRLFRALSSEARREILRQVATDRRTVTELAESFDMSLAAVSKHVGVLGQANLVTQSKEGRLHWCRLNPDALEPARATIEELRTFWNRQIDGLERFLADERRASEPKPRRQRKGVSS